MFNLDFKKDNQIHVYWNDYPVINKKNVATTRSFTSLSILAAHYNKVGLISTFTQRKFYKRLRSTRKYLLNFLGPGKF